MSNYRRWFQAGGIYFFTLVTYARRPMLTTEQSRGFLRTAIAEVRERRPFHIVATVLLPDHWHMVMQLPSGDADYSRRIKQVKASFTRQWPGSRSAGTPVGRSGLRPLRDEND